MSGNITAEQELEVQEAFSLADKNGTEAIQMKEVGRVMRSLGMNTSDEELQEMLAGKGDGVYLNYQEFLDIVKQKINKEENEEDELRE